MRSGDMGLRGERTGRCLRWLRRRESCCSGRRRTTRTPSDVESAEPASGAADNEYIVVVEVRSGEGERERKGSRAIRVRVSDEEEEITSVGPFEVVENQTRVGQLEAVDQDKQDVITEYEIAGGADGGLFAGG